MRTDTDSQTQAHTDTDIQTQTTTHRNTDTWTHRHTRSFGAARFALQSWTIAEKDISTEWGFSDVDDINRRHFN